MPIKKKTWFSKTLIYIVLIVGAFVALFPFIWMILTSIKSTSEAMIIPPTIFPKQIRIDNYTLITTKLPFFKIYLNTIVSAVVTVAAQLVFCSMAAYAFARIQFPGRNIIFITILAVLMVPGTFFILPQYRMMYSMGLLNTIPALFLPNLFSAMGTFLLRQFFLSLPQELEDAAYIDGCNRGRVFISIMLPLIKPGLVSLGILTFKFAWNDLMWPLIVNTSTDKMTLSAALSYLQGQYVTDYPGVMAGAIMSVVPIIVIFAIFQKQFIEGVAHTGIKG
ncbi:MAG: binding-protein-dependent transport system inner rane component [Lachnospiraceae bacterium]|nr:binding-protein-dependent transport system inner rane component [Lachnospiraceae bacterium]